MLKMVRSEVLSEVSDGHRLDHQERSLRARRRVDRFRLRRVESTGANCPHAGYEPIAA